MDLRLTSDEDQLVAAMSALLLRESTSEGVRAAESSGFDPTLWQHLLALGVPSMATSSLGAGAASLFQLCLLAEQAGKALASAPILEGFVAARLLERCGSTSSQLLDSVASGEMIATVSLRTAAPNVARLVPAGAIAQLVVGLDGPDLVAVVGDPPARRIENIGSMPLAYRDLVSGAPTVLASGPEAAEVFGSACRDWKILSAAQLVGVGAAALDLGVDYVKSREVFGAPIATFQTISHKLADDATALDGSRLLAYKAAWAVDEGRESAEALGSMAWCFASETALNVARDSLHYHGGYGFTREYDIQLYFRRAKAYSLIWGDIRSEYQSLADSILQKEHAQS